MAATQSRRKPRRGRTCIPSLSVILSFLSHHQVHSFSSGRAVTGRRENPDPFLYMTRDTGYESAMQKRHGGEEEEQSSYNFWEDPITTASFNMDLHNIAMEGAHRAQDALEIMEENYLSQQHNQNVSINGTSQYVKPNAASYTTVIDGWLQSDDENAAQKAQALLDRMERIYDETGDESIRPNAVTYMLVCQAWADDHSDCHSGTSAERAEQILQHMKERDVVPNVKVYTSILNAWCRQSGRVRGAMQRAERLLTEMESMNVTVVPDDPNVPSYRANSESIRPNIITYTTVIGGYSRSREPDSATRAEDILERMQQNQVEPDVVAYTTAINAWAKTKSRKERLVAASRAMSLLEEAEKMYANEQYHMKPSPITYATCINAIGNSLDPKAAELAEQVLRRMYSLHEIGAIAGVKPTTATFNSVITALARSKTGDDKRNAQKAESFLVEMTKRSQQGEAGVQPDVRTWSGVMLAWAESSQPDAAENAQRVLDHFEQLHDMGQTTIRPNVVCYTTVMRAWSASRRVDAVDNAEKILKRMEQRFGETGDTDLRPNAISYVTMINTFMRSNRSSGKPAAQRAQETVDRMMRLHAEDKGYQRPSRIVFNALINAWSRSNEKGSAKQAEKILEWMESQYRAGDDYVKPDDVTFCGVLNAWANHAKNGGARRAQQLLDHMEELTTQERGFQQSVICYNIVIKAWARSGEPDAIQRAEKILEGLEERQRSDPYGVRPDITTYSSVINCCAYYKGPPEGREEAFEVAMRTFKKICTSDYERPNHVTYGTLFKAISMLTPMGKARETIVKTIFERCCKDGQVDSFVLAQCRNACSAQLYRRLLGISLDKQTPHEDVASIFNNIPREWTRNVMDR